MSDLFWPGEDRAGKALSPQSLLEAMVRVEAAWLGVLVDSAVAPRSARSDLTGLADRTVAGLASGAAAAGNPVAELVSLLRDGLATTSPDAARWLHRGLTSQDVLDTALVLTVQEAWLGLRDELRAQIRLLGELARAHRSTPMAGRTLTQHAVPITFGLKVAHWLTGVLDAHDQVRSTRFPVQLGGAAGTMAAAVELGADADACRASLAGRLGLDDAPPWHTTRTTVTRIGDAAVTCTDAWGRVANDVLVLARPEVGELSEGVGGGSSTMPHKANPVLSVLVRRAALGAPQLAATLHLAAAESVDERSDGAWHLEWETLQLLVRRTVAAAHQVGDLLGGLVVHPERMAATLASAHDDLHAEHRSMAALAGHDATGDYLGQAVGLVDRVLDRADAALGDRP